MSAFWKVVGAGKKILTGGKQKTTGTEVIKSVETNVPKTDYQKSFRDLKIQVQKTKGSAAKLRHTMWQSKTGDYKEAGFTFAHDRGNVAKKSKKKSKKKSWKDQVDTSHPSYKD